MPRPAKPLIAASVGLLCVIWGTTWSVIAVGLAGIPPFSGVALRFSLAGVLLLLLARTLNIPLGREKHEKALWVVNSLFAFCLSYGVVYWGEQWVPSGLTAVLFATYPFFLALLGRILLPAETLSRVEALGIIVGFVGVAVIFSEDFNLLGGPEVLVASAVMLLSPAAAAVASLTVKRWGSKIHPLSITAVPMVLCGAVMGLIALAVERHEALVFDRTSISALAYLTVIGSAVSFSLYYWLLVHLPAKRLALITYVIPIIAMIIGILALGEPVTGRTLAGSALVMIGVGLAVAR